MLSVLTLLLILFSLNEAKQKDLYTFKVVNSRGRLVSLEKYRGSVSLKLEPTNFCTVAYANVPFVTGECMLRNFLS